MKNLFNIALTLFAAIALGTSCGVNEEITPVSQNFGTLIETPAGSKAPYYVLFDDGKSAYVTNTSQWNPTFGPNVSELRYLFSYEITNEQAIGYDYEITILSAKECMPTQYYLPNFTDLNIDPTIYDAGASVEACYISNANDYMTLLVVYNVDQFNMTSAPKLTLVQNTPENSPYKDLYEDDNYFYLELYHDDAAYFGNTQYSTNLSCKVTTPGGLKQLMSSYSGVKVISINHNTMQPTVKKFNFTTEEQQ